MFFPDIFHGLPAWIFVQIFIDFTRSAHARRPVCTLRVYTLLSILAPCLQAPCECSHPGTQGLGPGTQERARGPPRDPGGPGGPSGPLAPWARAPSAPLGGRGPWGPWGLFQSYSEWKVILNGKPFRMDGYFDWQAFTSCRVEHMILTF